MEQTSADRAAARAEFELTPPLPPGKVPSDVIRELELLADEMIAATKSFSEAIKEQAEKHRISRGALAKFIRARRSDRIGQLDAEAEAILSLIEQEQSKAS